MNALRKEAFFDRLPDEVEIKNAEQLRTIVASQIKEGEPTKLSLALEGGEVRTVTLAGVERMWGSSHAKLSFAKPSIQDRSSDRRYPMCALW